MRRDRVEEWGRGCIRALLVESHGGEQVTRWQMIAWAEADPCVAALLISSTTLIMQKGIL